MDYINGNSKVEILGSPKTVRLEGMYKGDTYSAPMEVWIMALVAVLTGEQKQLFFSTMNNVMNDGSYQKVQRAQVVADIVMPALL